MTDTTKKVPLELWTEVFGYASVQDVLGFKQVRDIDLRVD